jgi:hypothetical protein
LSSILLSRMAFVSVRMASVSASIFPRQALIPV